MKRHVLHAYAITEEMAMKVCLAAIAVNEARKELSAAKDRFFEACSGATDSNGNNLFRYERDDYFEGWVYEEPGEESGEPCTSDPRWKRFWAARLDRVKASRKLGAARAALTKIVMGMEASP